MTLESVVCWLWPARPGYRSAFGPPAVNMLRAMVRRCYPRPIRFLCVTDAREGFDDGIELVPAWNDFADVPSPHGGHNPSCYRRLRMFHPDIASVFGRRFVSLDLDLVLTGDVSPLWDRPEDIVLYGDTNPQPGSHYNGSMILLTAGARPQVWTEFDPATSPQRSKSARCFGSDQGHISYVLGGREAKWTRADGVYSFRNELAMQKSLPANARVVVFHGRHDPWDIYVQMNYAWVREHYRASEVAA